MINTELSNKETTTHLATLDQYMADLKEAEEKIRHSTEKLLNAMENTIRAMVRVVEMRDPYAAGHQRRAGRATQRRLRLGQHGVGEGRSRG